MMTRTIPIILLATVGLLGQTEGPLSPRAGERPTTEEAPEETVRDKTAIGAWETHTWANRMTDEEHAAIYVVGELLQGSRYNEQPKLTEACPDRRGPSLWISVRYLNPDDRDYASGGATFPIMIRFDKLKSRRYTGVMVSGGDAIYIGTRRGEGASILRHLRNSEKMLVQVNQYGGFDIYEFDVSDYSEARAWLGAECAGRRR